MNVQINNLFISSKRKFKHFDDLFLNNESNKWNYKNNSYEINIKYGFLINETATNINTIETFKIYDKSFEYSKIVFIIIFAHSLSV